ncbi:MAG: TIGR00730 family Rossman fold protein [Candidatus Dormibacteria bacterium]
MHQTRRTLSHLKSICVFAGSSDGNHPDFQKAAQDLGNAIAAHGCSLVYGGSDCGLMGTVAESALRAGGKVIGITPYYFKRKEQGSLVDITRRAGVEALTVHHASPPSAKASVLHPEAQAEEHYVHTMHDRTHLFKVFADAFIALPGGLGTALEIAEELVFRQVGVHAKPTGILNTQGVYRHFHHFADDLVSAGFLKPEHRKLLVSDSDPVRLISRLNREIAQCEGTTVGW